MLKLILAAVLASAAFASPAEAHKRYNHHRHPSYTQSFIFTPWGVSFRTRQPRVRINQNCVWKPWKNRTICRY